jgi:DNA-binding NarL/FixJ family response regulator
LLWAACAVKIQGMSALHILLIDDHAMFRSGLVMVLQAGLAQVCVTEAATLNDALSQASTDPALVLLDIQLQGLSGLECIAVLRQRWPGAAVVMLSADASPTTVQLALQRGAAAFVSKADTPSAMLAVLREVLSRRAICPSSLPVCSAHCQHPSLTARQAEVLDLLCQGLPNKTIGRRLGISENTVRVHVQALLALLDVAGRSEAVFAARQFGLIK